MDLFQPFLTLTKDGDGQYSLYSRTLGPNSCVRTGGVEFKAPEGHTPIKEATPVTLHIESEQSDFCLQMLTPVIHTIENVEIRPGSFLIQVFVVYLNEVEATQIIHLDQALPSLAEGMSEESDSPKQYNLSGIGMSVSISETSAGDFSINYEADSCKKTFTNDEIIKESSKIGTMLTALLDQVPDKHDISLTIVLPDFNKSENRRSVQINTIAVLTYHQTNFIGYIEGQVQRYETVGLNGNAW
jgi:hypothetical protein